MVRHLHLYNHLLLSHDSLIIIWQSANCGFRQLCTGALRAFISRWRIACLCIQEINFHGVGKFVSSMREVISRVQEINLEVVWRTGK